MKQYIFKSLGSVSIVFLSFSLVYCSNSASQQSEATTQRKDEIPENMVLVKGGTFLMGGKSEQAYYDEFPRHKVRVSDFLMDATEVTNAQFKKFVEETNYVTVAERDLDWEELKAQLPAGTPKPEDLKLKAGSLVFNNSGQVNSQDYAQWWKWTTGANWKQPEGPGSSINQK